MTLGKLYLEYSRTKLDFTVGTLQSVQFTLLWVPGNRTTSLLQEKKQIYCKISLHTCHLIHIVHYSSFFFCIAQLIPSTKVFQSHFCAVLEADYLNSMQLPGCTWGQLQESCAFSQLLVPHSLLSGGVRGRKTLALCKFCPAITKTHLLEHYSQQKSKTQPYKSTQGKITLPRPQTTHHTTEEILLFFGNDIIFHSGSLIGCAQQRHQKNPR